MRSLSFSVSGMRDEGYAEYGGHRGPRRV